MQHYFHLRRMSARPLPAAGRPAREQTFPHVLPRSRQQQTFFRPRRSSLPARPRRARSSCCLLDEDQCKCTNSSRGKISCSRQSENLQRLRLFGTICSTSVISASISRHLNQTFGSLFSLTFYSRDVQIHEKRCVIVCQHSQRRQSFASRLQFPDGDLRFDLDSSQNAQSKLDVGVK